MGSDPPLQPTGLDPRSPGPARPTLPANALALEMPDPRCRSLAPPPPATPEPLLRACGTNHSVLLVERNSLFRIPRRAQMAGDDRTTGRSTDGGDAQARPFQGNGGDAQARLFQGNGGDAQAQPLQDDRADA